MYRHNKLFGADDKLECPRCHGSMNLCRRTPDLERGEKYELQTFMCVKCDYAQTRIVDKDGAAPDVLVEAPARDKRSA